MRTLSSDSGEPFASCRPCTLAVRNSFACLSVYLFVCTRSDLVSGKCDCVASKGELRANFYGNLIPI